MPADYNSTARALALPVSPPRSPIQQHPSLRPSWARTQSQSALSRNRSGSRGPKGYLDKAIDTVTRLRRQATKLVKKLTLLQRIAGVCLLVVAFVLMVLFFVYNEAIFAWLEPYAQRWRESRGGWIFMFFLTFSTAFPPMIGYGTSVTIAGFVYGVNLGFPIVAAANVAGSLCSFITSRMLFSDFVHRLVANDSRFEAFSLVLKHDGLKMLVMIRLCPLPYSLSNGALSTVKTIQPLMFALATAIASPKLLIHVFIGDRLAMIARSGKEKDAATKAINYASIAGGVILGAVTGYIIYQRTVARARELRAEERSKFAPGPRGLSHPGDFSDDVVGDYDEDIEENDDIDFLGPHTREAHYQDEWDDDADEDEDEEGAIGMDSRNSKP